MQYALLIYGAEDELPESWEPARRDAAYAEYRELMRELRESGALLAAQRLQTTESATTLHVREGRVVTTDGPFAETREALGGFFLVQCDDLDAALRIAARIPSARWGRIEVRPVRG